MSSKRRTVQPAPRTMHEKTEKPVEGIALDCPKRRSWRTQVDSVGACARVSEPRLPDGANPGRTAEAVGARSHAGHAGGAPGPVKRKQSGNDSMRKTDSFTRNAGLDPGPKVGLVIAPDENLLMDPCQGRAAHSMSLCRQMSEAAGHVGTGHSRAIRRCITLWRARILRAFPRYRLGCPR